MVDDTVVIGHTRYIERKNRWRRSKARAKSALPFLTAPPVAVLIVALYGRYYCWSTVPRICGDVGGSDFNLRRRLFDAHAHDVRVCSASNLCVNKQLFRACERMFDRVIDRQLRTRIGEVLNHPWLT